MTPRPPVTCSRDSIRFPAFSQPSMNIATSSMIASSKAQSNREEEPRFRAANNAFLDISNGKFRLE